MQPTIVIPAEDRSAHMITMEPNVELILAFERVIPDRSRLRQNAEIVSHDGKAPIYYTLDGTPAAIAGPRTLVVPGAISSSVTPFSVVLPPFVARLISPGSPTVSVQLL